MRTSRPPSSDLHHTIYISSCHPVAVFRDSLDLGPMTGAANGSASDITAAAAATFATSSDAMKAASSVADAIFGSVADAGANDDSTNAGANASALHNLPKATALCNLAINKQTAHEMAQQVKPTVMPLMTHTPLAMAHNVWLQVAPCLPIMPFTPLIETAQAYNDASFCDPYGSRPSPPTLPSSPWAPSSYSHRNAHTHPLVHEHPPKTAGAGKSAGKQQRQQQRASPTKCTPNRPPILVTEGSALADILADVLTASPRTHVKSSGEPIQASQPQSPDEVLPKRSPLVAQQSAIAKKRRSVKDQSAAHALLALFAR